MASLRGRWLLPAVTTAVVAGIGAVSCWSNDSTALAAYAAPSRPASPQSVASAAYARLSPQQRIGQLFMTGVASSGATSSALKTLRAEQVGNVILVGDNPGGRASVRRVTSAVRAALIFRRTAAFISTDQEGGEVQRLTGPGFATMPSALQQGKIAPATLRVDAGTWGRQLAAAGVNLDLAPVADTVPAKHAKRNAPIGAFDRELGHTPRAVAAHVVPLVHGMDGAGVDTTVKHFPGLGRATGNTDTSPTVTDPTTRHDPYLEPYQAGVAAGAPFVMMSSARYPNIDPHHLACFSKVVIGSLLRSQLGFAGVVISDDLGTAALKRFSLGQRATGFFGAGGTMLLDTTASGIPAMMSAVTTKARSSAAFAKLLTADEMTVLLAKARAGLIAS